MFDDWYIVQVRLDGASDRKWKKVAAFIQREDAVNFISGNVGIRAYEFRTVQRQPKYKPVDPV